MLVCWLARLVLLHGGGGEEKSTGGNDLEMYAWYFPTRFERGFKALRLAMHTRIEAMKYPSHSFVVRNLETHSLLASSIGYILNTD